MFCAMIKNNEKPSSGLFSKVQGVRKISAFKILLYRVDLYTFVQILYKLAYTLLDNIFSNL